MTVCKRVPHPRKFGLTSDHARLDAFNATRLQTEGARLLALDEVRADGLAAAAHVRQLRLAHVEEAAHLPVRVV